MDLARSAEGGVQDALADGAGGELFLKAAASAPLTALEDEDVVELAVAAIGPRLDGKAAVDSAGASGASGLTDAIQSAS